ncbi:hypothetical protein BDP27DRAFT_1435485 [Rhodocollybia butyracea]|uniref:Ubiquitin-like protease family profile domain-containing protein n=1 Tax=Rhodocollybia butyracea TaxID=206335 RepID=A0A9P5P4I1_9AGAR|nr:hypothetical protein BDP27DRAFT_1435485 [Rhodocollybia butyracea]
MSEQKWSLALHWLIDPRGETETEYDLCSAVTDALASTLWTGPISMTQTESMDDVALVLGDNPLTGGVVNAMLELASRHLQHASPLSCLHMMITSTEFLYAIMNRHKTDSRYHVLLDKVQNLFTANGEDSHFTELLFVVHSPPIHWISCLIEFINGVVWFGDGFREPAPDVFVTELLKWLSEKFTTSFTVRDDLECREQNDRYSCPIIAINSIEHHVFGDELWVPESVENENILEIIRARDTFELFLCTFDIPSRSNT